MLCSIIPCYLMYYRNGLLPSLAKLLSFNYRNKLNNTNDMNNIVINFLCLFINIFDMFIGKYIYRMITELLFFRTSTAIKCNMKIRKYGICKIVIQKNFIKICVYFFGTLLLPPKKWNKFLIKQWAIIKHFKQFMLQRYFESVFPCRNLYRWCMRMRDIKTR